MSGELIKAYASYFVSYLLKELERKDLQAIKQIILFGSSVREDASKESDIDIFIDVSKKKMKLENNVKELVEEFYKSREALLFKTKGIDNKINIIISKLKDWAELEKSIEGGGIVLYGLYRRSRVEGRKYALFYWDKIAKNRGAFLNKIYGFKVRSKRYEGLIKEFEGRKIGKSSALIPIEHSDEVIKLFKKYGVNAKIIEVYA